MGEDGTFCSEKGIRDIGGKTVAYNNYFSDCICDYVVDSVC